MSGKCDDRLMTDLDTCWSIARPAVVRCLELAHAGLLAGGLPCGAVVTDSDGTLVTEGRNRTYDRRGGNERLQRTPIAHAEMNALAAIDTDTDLTALRLVSSHRPCQMCSAVCSFTGVGAVDFVAPDPSDAKTYPDPDGMPAEWIVVANLLFLTAVANYSGPSAPMIARAREREPEVADLMGLIDETALTRPTLREALSPCWPAISAAADQRRQRC
jgi:tRNA(Arg) A34 adenosine deaminase TadA